MSISNLDSSIYCTTASFQEFVGCSTFHVSSPKCFDVDNLDLILANGLKHLQGNETYLLNSLGGQYKGVLLTHAHTIFDANPNSPEVLWPSFVVGDINTTWKY